MYKSHVNSVHIEVTDRCNALCPACPRSFSGSFEMPYVKNQELGLEYFKLLGKEFISNIRTWNFCGTKGDPASAQELFEILDYILDCNPKAFIEVRTNGGARNPKFWKSIGERFKGTYSSVVWSIDGWEETNHIYRRNVKWSKLFENLQAYVRTEAPAKWEFNKFAHNMHELPIIENFCKKNNIDLILREPFGFETLDAMTIDSEYKEQVKTLPVYKIVDDMAVLDYEIEPFDKENKILVSTSRKQVHKDEIGLKPGVYNKENWYNVNGTNIDVECVVSTKDHRQEIYIDSDGTILPCCYIGSKYIMGDEQCREMIDPVKESLIVSADNSIYDVLNSDFFQTTMPSGIQGNMDNDVEYCITCLHHCRKR